MRRPFLAATFVAASLVTLSAASRPERRHAHLLKSDPMADSTVVAPAAIRLWFSESVELGVSAVKVADSAGLAIKTGALRYDGDSGARSPVVASIAKTLPPGKYTVRWVVASADGHAVKGEFAFRVKAEP